jgi:hypothetical protein
LGHLEAESFPKSIESFLCEQQVVVEFHLPVLNDDHTVLQVESTEDIVSGVG